MKNNMNNIPVLVSIPDDLIYELLTGLPVKSLLRFRCVCKRWKSIISDASFVEDHRSRSAAGLLFSAPYCRCPRLCSLVNVKEGEARRPLSPVLSHAEFAFRDISQSVNGLVCIFEQYERSNYYYYDRETSSPRVLVHNPSTREHVTLPPTIFTDVWSCYQSISLGFDPSTKTYKILTEWSTTGGSKYEIFTLGSGEWRVINDYPFNGLPTKGLCLNGTIYWATSKKIEREDQNILIAFDVGEEKFRYVPAPPASRAWVPCQGITWNMFQIDDVIAVVDYRDVADGISNVITMWKLEDSINGIWSDNRIVLPEFSILSTELPYTKRFLARDPTYPPFIVDSINSCRPFITSINSGEITLIPNRFFADWYMFHYNLEEERVRVEIISPENGWGDYFDPSIDSCDISVYKKSLTSLREICRL